ncbi:hypothetical protein D3C84_929160 [compost metagenome]
MLEGRREDDIEQSTLLVGPHFGHAAQRRTDLAFGTDDTQITRAFGYQYAFAFGQKSQRPRVVQAFGQGADLDAALLALEGAFGSGMRQQR